MKTYIAQRLGIGFLTLLGMSIVIFGMLRLAPGDIVDILFSTGGYVNPAERAAIEKELGLDRPVWVQYVEWIRQIVTGDLGKSYQSGRVVIWRHALKNAILPVVTVIGIEFAFLIGGLVVTETVFNLPGLARFLVEAILWRDYPIVQNLVMFIAIVVILSNLFVDMLYGFLDPRVRYGH